MPQSAIVTVPFKQMGQEYGLNGGWDDKGPFTIRPYLIAWADKSLFMRQMAGGSTYSGPATGGEWGQVLPFRDPDDENLFVVGLKWKPEGRLLTEDPLPASYTHAVVTAEFRRLTYDFSFDQSDKPMMSLDNETVIPSCTQSISFGAEHYDIGGSQLKFESDNKVVNTPASTRVQTCDVVLHFHKLPYQPFPRLRAFADTINSTAFLGCAAETVLYLGADTETGEADADGNPTREVIIRLKWRRISWNKMLRPNSSVWDYVKKPDASRIYQTAQFANLLLSVKPS